MLLAFDCLRESDALDHRKALYQRQRYPGNDPLAADLSIFLTTKGKKIELKKEIWNVTCTPL